MKNEKVTIGVKAFWKKDGKYYSGGIVGNAKEIEWKIGETKEVKGNIKLCENGFHFFRKKDACFAIDFYSPRETYICEVEVYGDIEYDTYKRIGKKMKLIRDITKEVLNNIDNNHNSGKFNSGNSNSGNSNSGNRNSGDRNSGDRNSGNSNSGNYNSGDFNSDDRNSGDFNSGNRNSGDRNSGDRNSGDYNSGDYNSGDFNSGNSNSGNSNSGNYNSGNYNSGNRNSGNRNSGDYNSGDYNSGIFNTNEPYMYAFNKPTKIKFSEWINSDSYIYFDIDLTDKTYKEAWKEWWKKNKSEEMIKRIKRLPNFDAEIFFKITGIRMHGSKSEKGKSRNKKEKSRTETTHRRTERKSKNHHRRNNK